MKRFILFFLVLLVPSHPLYGASSLTLDDALTIALKNHPQLIEAREHLIGAEARTGQSLSSYYPQISIVADWSRGRSYLTPLERIRLTEVHTGALSLKQTIYDFGRTAGAVDAARGNREAADKAVAVTRQDVALRVRSAFYFVLAAEKQVTATGKTVKAREEVHLQALEYFRQGIRAKVDVATAEANYFSARTELIRAENNLELARVELAGAMGLSSLDARSPVEPVSMERELPERLQAQHEAVLHRAELRQLAALKSAASGNLRSARSTYFPVLSGTASYGYADRDFPPDGEIWEVGLNATMPLFSGFSSVEQVREATATINAIEAQNSNLRLQIVREVETAWLGAKEAAARIASTEKAVAAAQENQELAEGRYHEGVGSIIEVTDAQSLALEAQTAHIQARYDYLTAAARLDRAMGKD